jgi:hypothetical protein
VVNARALGKSAKQASASGMKRMVVVLSFINGFMVGILSLFPGCFVAFWGGCFSCGDGFAKDWPTCQAKNF